MFGLRAHRGRKSGATGGSGDPQESGPEAREAGQGFPDLKDWNDTLVRFMGRRADSYGALLDDMRECRNPVELGAAQQRWWLQAVQDYVGFASQAYELGARGTAAAPDELQARTEKDKPEE